jgi:hypothetical protein
MRDLTAGCNALPAPAFGPEPDPLGGIGRFRSAPLAPAHVSTFDAVAQMPACFSFFC